MRSEQAESRWRHEGYVPTFNEYLENGAYSSAALLSMAQILIGVEQADENAYKWAMNNDNKFSIALEISTRLYNDITTNEVNMLEF